MPFYGVSGAEAEGSWGTEVDKSRMYFPVSVHSSIPTLSPGHDTEIRDNEDSTHLNFGSGLFPESTAYSLSFLPFRPTDLLSTLPLCLDSI